MPFKVRNTKFDVIVNEDPFETEASAQLWINQMSAGGDPVTEDTPHINNTDCVIEEY